ncbi:hypothetical protein ABZ713_25155, partial [Streptomyces sp. NPDC006875]
MNALSGVKRTLALAVTTLAAIAVSTVPGSAAPAPGVTQGGPDHWGVITRNTIGSPVAALRNGPFGSFGVTGRAARPP